MADYNIVQTVRSRLGINSENAKTDNFLGEIHELKYYHVLSTYHVGY